MMLAVSVFFIPPKEIPCQHTISWIENSEKNTDKINSLDKPIKEFIYENDKQEVRYHKFNITKKNDIVLEKWWIPKPIIKTFDLEGISIIGNRWTAWVNGEEWSRNSVPNGVVVKSVNKREIKFFYKEKYSDTKEFTLKIE
jgi:hypothetical protein